MLLKLQVFVFGQIKAGNAIVSPSSSYSAAARRGAQCGSRRGESLYVLVLRRVANKEASALSSRRLVVVDARQPHGVAIAAAAAITTMSISTTAM